MRPLHQVPVGGRFRAGLTRREGKVLRKGEGSIKVRWARGRTDTFNTSAGERVSIPRQPIEFIGPTTEVEWPLLQGAAWDRMFTPTGGAE